MLSPFRASHEFCSGEMTRKFSDILLPIILTNGSVHYIDAILVRFIAKRIKASEKNSSRLLITYWDPWKTVRDYEGSM